MVSGGDYFVPLYLNACPWPPLTWRRLNRKWVADSNRPTTITSNGPLGRPRQNTLAYLVPAILSRKRVVVATATKALQDQLVGKDLSLTGIGFSHDHELPTKHAVISLDHPKVGRFAVEAEIVWTRPTPIGLYESGCRLVRTVGGHTVRAK